MFGLTVCFEILSQMCGPDAEHDKRTCKTTHVQIPNPQVRFYIRVRLN